MKASAELKTPLIPATVRPRAKGEGDAMTLDSNIRAALERHWAASDANDFNAEHQIYRQDAVLEYPQSGERIRGRDKIQASRMAQPNYKRFSVRRIIGAANLWVTEFILTYDGRPSYTVSIMEFSDEQVIPDCGDTDSSAAPSAPSTAPISHWTTIRFCNGCPGRAARSMSQGLRVLV